MTNLRDAYRSATSTPVVSCLAILSVGLGIGANTAIFSIANSLLLKPLPVRAPNELVVVDSAGPGEWYGVGYPIWREIRDRKVFGQAFAWGTDRVALSDPGEITFAEAIWASGNAFDVLGVGARRGRTFSSADDHPSGGSAGVAVISDRFWRRNFGGAADVVGRSLVIERVPYTIVGIMPADFYGLTVGGTFDVMLPLETEPLLGRIPKRLESPLWTWLYIMGRRTGSETPESLTAALSTAHPDIRIATLPARLARAEDRVRYLSTGWVVRSAPGGLSRLRRLYGPAVLTLLAIVGIVLLIACANVATLLLARSRARTAEFSVRRALGASTAHLVRQLLAESVLLSAIGAVTGVLLARWSTPLLVAELSTWASTSFLDLSVDWRVLSVTVLTTVATGLAFGTLPAYRGIRVPPVNALKGPRQDGGGGRAVGALVVAQIALSLVLLIVRRCSFARSLHWPIAILDLIAIAYWWRCSMHATRACRRPRAHRSMNAFVRRSQAFPACKAPRCRSRHPSALPASDSLPRSRSPTIQSSPARPSAPSRRPSALSGYEHMAPVSWPDATLANTIDRARPKWRS